jgi:hypothetical protein
MRRQQCGRLDRLEQRFGAQPCVAHQISIFIRDAATGREQSGNGLCRRCGRPARSHVIELEVVPARPRRGGLATDEREASGRGAPPADAPAGRPPSASA